MKEKPITPYMLQNLSKEIPDEVIKAVNTLIRCNWKNGQKRAIITQKDLIELILENFKKAGNEKIKRENIFENGWFDIEDVYEGAGWLVEYNGSCIGDNFESYFVFKKGV